MYNPLLAWLALLSLAEAHPADLSTTLEHRATTSTPRSIVYIQTFHTTSGGQLSLLPLLRQQTRITHIYLSSLHINGNPGDITLNDNSPNASTWDTVWSEAAQLQQNGVKVMMMLGGAAKGSYPRLCSGNVINDAYYIPLRNTLRYHKIDGLDLDIEENVNESCPLALLRRLDRDFGSNFILTMAPVASELTPAEFGLGGFSYSALDSQATSSTRPNGKLVNWYNAQFYNGWGDSSNPAGYNAIIAHGYSPGRVVMGVLDSPRDGGSGWYSVGTYKKTVSTLKANYAKFGGDVGWEYWDAGSGDNYAEPWRWAKDMGTAVFGTSAAQQNVTVPPELSYGPSPWPGATQTLEGLGVLHLAAIRALNLTDGSLEAALKLLGLSDILPLNGVLPGGESE